MMHPTGPCFVTMPNGYLSFEASYTPPQKATLLGSLNGLQKKINVYDGTGMKWRSKEIQSRWRKSWWVSLLANTVFNPRVDITVVWTEPQPYVIDELKLAYVKAIEKDDDILTQFVDREELTSKVSSAVSFDDLVTVYRWMKTE